MLTGYEDLVAKHAPPGYELRRRDLKHVDGLVERKLVLTVAKRLPENEAIFVFLHECGHVHCGHFDKRLAKVPLPRWQEEYEADQYAIEALKSAKMPISRVRLAFHKSEVRRLIEEGDGTEHVPDDILRYAYGRQWRQFK